MLNNYYFVTVKSYDCEIVARYTNLKNKKDKCFRYFICTSISYKLLKLEPEGDQKLPGSRYLCTATPPSMLYSGTVAPTLLKTIFTQASTCPSLSLLVKAIQAWQNFLSVVSADGFSL